MVREIAAPLQIESATISSSRDHGGLRSAMTFQTARSRVRSEISFRRLPAEQGITKPARCCTCVGLVLVATNETVTKTLEPGFHLTRKKRIALADS